MFYAPIATPQSLAARLRPFLRMPQGNPTLAEVLACVDGEGGLGPVLFLLTLPVLLPLPPGLTMALAAPLLAVALQIVAGRRELWLPRAIGRQAINRDALVRTLRWALPPLERAESLMRPRLTSLTGSLGTRLVGITCTLIALVLILPIPFNLLPAMAMGLLALGLSRRDGLVVLAGYGLFGVSAAAAITGVHSLEHALHHLRALV